MKNKKPLFTKLFSIGAGLFLLSGFSVLLTKVSNIGPVYASSDTTHLEKVTDANDIKENTNYYCVYINDNTAYVFNGGERTSDNFVTATVDSNNQITLTSDMAAIQFEKAIDPHLSYLYYVKIASGENNVGTYIYTSSEINLDLQFEDWAYGYCKSSFSMISGNFISIRNESYPTELKCSYKNHRFAFAPHSNTSYRDIYLYKEVEETGPAIGDTFTDDNGINYEITAVGDTNTVKVGDNKGFTGTSLNIPNTVTYKDVTFNVTELSEKAFMDCTAIESVTLPSNLVSIPNYLFDGCSKLANITFPTTLENIGKYAFRGCHFTSVTIPASVKTMGDSFANNQYLQTVICEPLTPPTASESIFSACYQLTSIQVHLSAIDAYKNAIYWSDHVDKIESIEDYVTEISMKTNPNKTEYLVGEELDLTGAEIRVGTAKGSITSVAVKADMVTGYDKNKVGEQTLTVTYEGKTTTFKVTVKEAPLPPEPVNDGLSGGAIAGIAIGAVAGVALISYVVMFAVYAKTGKGLKFLFGSFDWLKKLFKMK